MEHQADDDDDYIDDDSDGCSDLHNHSGNDPGHDSQPLTRRKYQ